MDESGKLAEKIGIVVQGGQVTIHAVNLSQAEVAPSKSAEPTELPDCPYRGLFAFQEEHAEFFFGRDFFTQSLVQAVKTKPFVAVVGASGSGKSSLVFAGLLPNLLEQGGWCIFKLRPGFPDSRPFHNLTSALLPLSAVPDLDPLILLNQRAEALRNGTVSLQDVIAEILRQAPTGTERVLLVVDQFEELYTLCSQADRERFVDLLLAGDALCKVVLTLRADFCGQAYAYRPLVDALQDADLKLGSMKQEELQAAIEKPAEKMGVKLEAGLTERILEDVGKEPGNLPLLEFALTRLWEKQQNCELTHAAYSEIGGVKQALADHAEAIYSKLTEAEQKQAQQIFVQLVQLGEGTADTRRLAIRAEISDNCWQLITRKGGLADCRLVVTGRNDQTNEETVEVVHEALIREWQRLRQWIDADRKKLLQKNEIEAQAKRWLAQHKSKDYLLQGKRLQEAEAFQKEQLSYLPFNSLPKEFIQKELTQKGKRFQEKLRTIKAFQREQLGYLSLSSLATEFIQNSLQKRRNNRLKLVSLGLWAPLGLATFLGFQIQRQIVISGHWETIEKAQGQKDSPARIAALQELVKRGVSLANLSLPSANLNNANFTKANLSNANLRNADLSNADLKAVNLSDANLSGANFGNIRIFNSNLSGADLRNANLSNAELSYGDFTGSNLTSANLTSAALINADLRGVNLSDANLSNALVSANLNRAMLRRADLSEARIVDANFSEADLIDTNLSGAELKNVNFRNAYLSNTNFKSASIACITQDSSTNQFCTDFRGAKYLTPEQVKSAKNWEQAIYDPAFCQQLGLKECKTKQPNENEIK